MSFVKKYAKKYWKPFFAALAFLSLEAFCDLLQPTIMSRIVDVGVANRDLRYVLNVGGIMLLVTALGAVGAICRNAISSKVSQKFGADLRLDLFKKIHSLSLENIDRFETASLVTRLTNDVTQVQNFANGMMRIFVKAPILCVGSLIMASLINLRMAIVLVVVVPIVILLIYLNMHIGYPFFTKVQNSLDNVNSVMREYLSGVRVVKAFNRFAYETERFERANSNLSEVSATAMRVMAVFTPGVTLTVNIGTIAVLWLGGRWVNVGKIQVGQVIAFINYMTQILNSLMIISRVFNTFVRAKASAERINDVLTEESTIKVNKEVNELKYSQGDNGQQKNEKGSIEFQDVYFSYSGAAGDPVLKGITFKCNPGETVGIIGSTGSGKTTLINLIPRFYDATSGTIKVNGFDVKNTDPRILREHIAIVPQKTVLFTGTIIDNIKWGNEKASFEDVQKAAQAAQAHEFISNFPEGYNTFLGQGGVNLSGGQKQRISIARALVGEKDILILDDCTSAVDVTTEARIREALKQYFGNLTCIIIAQRITSVMHADKIIVLENGEINGIGKHEELIKTCEVYRDIYRSQVGLEEL